MSVRRRLLERRRLLAILVCALAGVTTMVVAGRYALRPSPAPRQRPHLGPLASALTGERTRPLDGRVNGLPYAPSASLTRGGGDTTVSAELWAAAADLRVHARHDDSPEGDVARALACALTGEWDKSIATLTDAGRRQPDNPIIESDLAAVYLTRARRQRVDEDWVNALEAADRAIGLDAQSPEAHFNRALALEGLYLSDRAIAAWTEAAAMDPGSAWSDEARRRADVLRQRSVSRAAAPADHQTERERIEDVLLPEWGEAILAGRIETAAHRLDEAAAVAERVVSGGGDGMASDQIARIRALQARGAKAGVSALARGHVRYGAARVAYLADDQQRAADLMSQASRDFAPVASAYGAWGAVFRAIVARNRGDLRGSLDELASVRATASTPRYLFLRGRYEWAMGVALNELTRLDVGRDHLARAVAAFRGAGEGDNRVAAEALLAEVEWVLGNRTIAWRTLIGVFEAIDRRPPAKPRSYHFWVAASLAESIGARAAAIEFETEGLESSGAPRAKAGAHLQRARTRQLAGDTRGALDDLAEAERAVSSLEDPALRDRNAADVRIARAELLSATNPRLALEEATTALAYVSRASPVIRLPRLLTVRAHCREALNDFEGARADLLAAIDAFEAKRATLVSVTDRMQAYQDERVAFKELVRLETVARRDPAGGLRAAERARAGAIDGAGRPGVVRDPTVDHVRLPRGVALIYYETLPDRVLGWVVTRDRWSHFTSARSLESLTDAVRRIDRLVRDDAEFERLIPETAPLFDDLVAPALAAAPGASTLVFVPDGPLFSVPFAALADHRRQPLVAAWRVAVAPNLTTFLAASSRLGAFSAADVLAVGDGHEWRTSPLPALPAANDEARAVGAVYPAATVLTGSAATARRLLRENRAVVHFAGHTVVNREFPLFSRLVLAPDGEAGGDALLASAIARHTFPRTGVVVLATCEAAAGRAIDGEGVVSMASAFLAAGVPSVVASLWPVDDNTQRLFTTFHQELRRRGDPGEALRFSQLDLLRERGARTPVRLWGGLMALGGVSPAR